MRVNDTEKSPYFIIDINGKQYIANDETLRGGWWNEQSRADFYDNKTIYNRAFEINFGKNFEREFDKLFPDIARFIKQISRENEVKPFDGYVQFDPNADDKFYVTHQRTGLDIDERDLKEQIVMLLRHAGANITVYAKTKVAKPRPEAEITALLGLRGAYTTYFEQNPNREDNIELALGKFNGLVIENGQTVSFNQIVGARSMANGFKEAKIILDGEFVPGVGGGVCQASTTIFNAVLLAGLEIEKSHNHSLAISYVPVGRDAMVSSSADLRFKNTTGHTVYIETGVKKSDETNGRGYCFVRVYGTKTNVKYRIKNEVTELDLNDDEIDPARRAQTYVEAYSGDKLVRRTLVRKSFYSAQKLKN